MSSIIKTIFKGVFLGYMIHGHLLSILLTDFIWSASTSLGTCIIRPNNSKFFTNYYASIYILSGYNNLISNEDYILYPCFYEDSRAEIEFFKLQELRRLGNHNRRKLKKKSHFKGFSMLFSDIIHKNFFFFLVYQI